MALPAKQGINLQIIGEDQGVRKMLTATLEAVDPAHMLLFMGGMVTPYIEARIASRFSNEGDDVSGKWAPLKETTQHIRETEGYGPDHPINVRSGAMKEWLLSNPPDLTTNGLEAIMAFPGGNPSQSVENKLETAQRGSSNPETVPRPVLGLNSADAAFVLMALSEWVSRWVSLTTGALL